MPVPLPARALVPEQGCSIQEPQRRRELVTLGDPAQSRGLAYLALSPGRVSDWTLGGGELACEPDPAGAHPGVGRGPQARRCTELPVGHFKLQGPASHPGATESVTPRPRAQKSYFLKATKMLPLVPSCDRVLSSEAQNGMSPGQRPQAPSLPLLCTSLSSESTRSGAQGHPKTPWPGACPGSRYP